MPAGGNKMDELGGDELESIAADSGTTGELSELEDKGLELNVADGGTTGELAELEAEDDDCALL